ncbi:DnaJ domain-containing protein, partial [Streptococcus pyogenes]|uniref:DnaJ domain-containing protein n=1 Tax=Streptococcus pyogenes TaxID=1314 RepID=UPI003DA0A860
MMNLYQILGVPPHATEAEIKKAYRSLSKKYHPDLNPADPQAKEKIIEINKAHDVLSNPEARSNYDYILKRQEEYQQN